MSERSLPAEDFLGLRLSLLDASSVLAAVADAVATGRPLRQASLNAAKVVAAARDSSLRDLLNRFDLLNADGMSVAWGARLLGLPPVPRLAGIDLMQALLARAENAGWSVYFLGSRPEVLAEMQAAMLRRHPRLRVAGAEHGYHAPERDAGQAAAIRASGAGLLFVGMPSPRKEDFLDRHGADCGTAFAMGVGGSFDVLAGRVRRAPRLLQRTGLEWSFRLAQEPRRLWRRYLATNSRFLTLLLRERLFGARTGG